NGNSAIDMAARELAQGNLSLSDRTEQQASSLEETAAAMEQLTSTVKQNADNAQEASRLASNASLVATKGGDAVGEAIETMSTINASSRK
ncbi:methyl-accepting chemotaxis protein, partial [Klebsiella pneumoniae]|nr:methyl-accepting chemotaxis protein [Klebsiella pneumoniae]